MASNKKNEQLKSLEKNILKSLEALVHSCSTATCFGNSKKFLKKCLTSWDLSTPWKIDPITLFLCCNVLKISKKLLVKVIKKFDGNGKYQRKMKFMILATRDGSNPKATLWNSFENFMSVKTHFLKIASVAKLYSSICWYFGK